MYAQFFGLRQEPFSIAPDPRYLFMSERHREALAHMLYGVGGGGGFVLLTGEIGTGKTTVCRCFLEQIPGRCNVAYIFNPKLTVTELLKTICDEFHIPLPANELFQPTVKDYVDRLNEFLLRSHAEGLNNVLIIDEAQNLAPDVLEQLRLLTNLETSERKLLQIMLIGQPELRTMLARPDQEQLAQRVIARFHLDALSESEAALYIQHRLTVAGLQGALPFDRKAIRRIHRLTGGVPRRMNLLCDRALLGAYATGKATVTSEIVDKAAREVFEKLPAQPGQGRMALLGAGVVAGALAVAAIAWLMGERGGFRPVAQQAASRPASSAAVAAVPVTAASAASAPASAAAPALPEPPAFDLKAALASLPQDEDEALRAMGSAWGLQLAGSADPCRASERQKVNCFRRTGSLALLRQLNRPAVLTLYGDDNRAYYAPLAGASERTLTFTINGAPQRVQVSALADTWRGEFATFWRTPEGYSRKVVEGSTGPAVDWLAQQLAVVEGAAQPPPRQKFDAALKARLNAFQLAQGLVPDGQAGPMTLMQLNRVAGVEEPRLAPAAK
jgi:general secretion pathway protein A